MRDLVVITGCDSGIGRALAAACAARGFAVAASFLEENPFEGARDVSTARLDLRRDEEIAAFAAFVEERCAAGHRLRGLVNNAGVALGGPFENLPLRLYRECFEVNFFGLVGLTQRLLPALMRSRGLLVVIGSLAGRIALPFLSPYASSKFALEGFCDAVRRELLPCGVRTVLVEPSGVATPIWDKSLRQDVSFMDPRYAASMDAFKERFIMQGNLALEAGRAAERILRIIEARRPRARYLISKHPALDRLKLLIPAGLLDRLVRRLFDMDYGPPAGGPSEARPHPPRGEVSSPP